MTLSPGVRLGAYEIVALAGAGGMGEVYQAHDTKLGRAAATHSPTLSMSRVRMTSRLTANSSSVSSFEGPSHLRRRLRRSFKLVLNWFEELKARVPVK